MNEGVAFRVESSTSLYAFSMQSALSLRRKKPPKMDAGKSKKDKAGRKIKEEAAAPMPVSNPTTRSKVGSLMKRRYSTRGPILSEAALQQSLQDASAEHAMPAMPSLPRQPSDQTKGFDLKQLDVPGFNPERFVKEKLANLSETELRAFYQDLKNSSQSTSGDLQKNVFKNYAEFVTISKEISNFETDMLVLRGLLEDWRSISDSLQADDAAPISIATTDVSISRRRPAARNSVADLQAIWKAQMESLWEGVEGSQKFLPHAPGRHIIRESSAFVELNAATYKAKQPVHLFLLNDHFLVAVKKKRQMSSKIQLVAERCWPLSELVVVDLKEGEVSNAIKIKKAKESFIYRTDKLDEKKGLLSAFRRVAEELFMKKRKEQEQEIKAREPGINLDADSFGKDGGLSPMAGSVFSPPGGSTKEYSWVDDIADEIDIDVALRNFEQAVSTIEKARVTLLGLEKDVVAMEMLRAKLDGRTTTLTNVLGRDLNNINLKKTAVVKTIGWFNRLGQGYVARDIFLTARSKLIKTRSRQIKFEGDVPLYIGELSMVTFTLIKDTSEWYTAAFRDVRMASGFIRWAKAEVEAFCTSFVRQVYGTDEDPNVAEEAYAEAVSQSDRLRDVGLDVRFILEDKLRRR